MVPMLRYVGSKGNTTVYEWRTGFEPARVEKPEVQVVPEQPKEDTVWCCSAWGCLLQLEGSLCPLGFRAPLPFLLQIDWGDFTLEPIGGGDADNTAAGGEAQDNEIDWGIVVEPSPQVSAGCLLLGPGPMPGAVAGALQSPALLSFIAGQRH